MQATQNLPQLPPDKQLRDATLAEMICSNPQPRVRAAQQHTPNVRTFYVGSESRPGLEYAVQFIRKRGMKRWQCTCPQFFYRCVARRQHCKHLRLLAAMARLAHGVSSLTIMGVRRES